MTFVLTLSTTQVHCTHLNKSTASLDHSMQINSYLLYRAIVALTHVITLSIPTHKMNCQTHLLLSASIQPRLMNEQIIHHS